MKILALVFPIHFCIFMEALFKREEQKIENILQTLSVKIAKSEGDEPDERSTYKKALKLLKEVRQNQIRIRELHNRHQVRYFLEFLEKRL